jgi:solute carrier family 25 folate transporter 32
MDRSAPPWVHSVAALTAGVVSTTLTHPLDLVKARFQVQHVSKQAEGELRYRSTLQAFRTIFRTVTISGLIAV